MSAGTERMAPLTPPTPAAPPRGWYALGAAADLTAGRILPASVAGNERLAYRGASGRIHVVDPHCPRRGCPLGDGEVAGEGLRCPVDGRLWCPQEADHDQATEPAGTMPSHPVAEASGLLFTAVGAVAGTPPARVTGPFRRACVRAHPHAVLECLTAPEVLGGLLGLTIGVRSVGVEADGALGLDLDVLGPDGSGTGRVRAGGPGWATLSLPGPEDVLVAATPSAGRLDIYLVGQYRADGLLDELARTAGTMTRLDRSSLPGAAGERWALVRRWAEGGAR